MSSAPEAPSLVKMIVPLERGRRQNQDRLFHNVRDRDTGVSPAFPSLFYRQDARTSVKEPPTGAGAAPLRDIAT
jgi:hypothetical protein